MCADIEKGRVIGRSKYIDNSNITIYREWTQPFFATSKFVGM